MKDFLMLYYEFCESKFWNIWKIIRINQLDQFDVFDDDELLFDDENEKFVCFLQV